MGMTANELQQWLQERRSIELLDLRRAAARAAEPRGIAGARWLDPALWLDWKDNTAQDRPVVVYCAHGREISQGLATALKVMGRDVHYLEGGLAAWQAAGLATETLGA